MNETQSVIQHQKFGRTWVDLLVYLLLIGIAIGIIIIILGGGMNLLNYIPLWLVVSIGLSLVWIPFLTARAKEDSRLIIVVDSPSRLTEYRVGKRYPLDIDGGGISFSSKSGTNRLILTELDIENNKAKGSALEGFTTFDYIRDMTTLQRLSEKFRDYLKEDRVTNETLGLNVESKVQEYSSTWLDLMYGSIDPKQFKDILEREENFAENEELLEPEIEGDILD